MSDTPTITKEQVRAALAEFKIGRSRGRAYQCMRGVLRQHGDGAQNIHELDPKFYAAVYAAAGGVKTPTAEDFYGVATDAPAPEISPVDHYGVVLDVPAKPATIDPPSLNPPPPPPPPPPRPILRLRSPLTTDLETRLAAAMVKTKRSFPGGRVDLGNASRPEDQADDVVRDFPAGERVR